MSYRNKTYVIFDGDNDLWAYRLHEWLERERARRGRFSVD